MPAATAVSLTDRVRSGRGPCRWWSAMGTSVQGSARSWCSRVGLVAFDGQQPVRPAAGQVGDVATLVYSASAARLGDHQMGRRSGQHRAHRDPQHRPAPAPHPPARAGRPRTTTAPTPRRHRRRLVGRHLALVNGGRDERDCGHGHGTCSVDPAGVGTMIASGAVSVRLLHPHRRVTPATRQRSRLCRGVCHEHRRESSCGRRDSWLMVLSRR